MCHRLRATGRRLGAAFKTLRLRSWEPAWGLRVLHQSQRHLPGTRSLDAFNGHAIGL